jgi:hypothetical protein
LRSIAANDFVTRESSNSGLLLALTVGASRRDNSRQGFPQIGTESGIGWKSIQLLIV